MVQLPPACLISEAACSGHLKHSRRRTAALPSPAPALPPLLSPQAGQPAGRHLGPLLLGLVARAWAVYAAAHPRRPVLPAPPLRAPGGRADRVRRAPAGLPRHLARVDEVRLEQACGSCRTPAHRRQLSTESWLGQPGQPPLRPAHRPASRATAATSAAAARACTQTRRTAPLPSCSASRRGRGGASAAARRCCCSRTCSTTGGASTAAWARRCRSW